GRLLRWLLFEPFGRLLALDHRVDDEQRHVDVVLAQLGRLRLDERSGGERRRRPRSSARVASAGGTAGDLTQGPASPLDEPAPTETQDVEGRRQQVPAVGR